VEIFCSMKKSHKMIAAILVAMILLWIAGALFCNAPFIMVPHAALQTMGYPEGSRVVWRTEGWGTGRFGKWGVSGIPDIETRSEQKVVLWGDSYVEAHQVDDEKRTAHQLTQLLDLHGAGAALAVNAGFSGQSVADYPIKIPVYEKQMPPIAAHVVVIGQIEDFFPNDPPVYFSRFATDPEPQIIPAKLRDPSRLKWLIYRWGVRLHANGLISVLRNNADGFNLRFALGPVKKNVAGSDPGAPSAEELERWFSFYARKFRTVTEKPLFLVYLPTVPKLDGNGWSFVDEDEETAAQMERIFTVNGWTVINMKDRFVQNFESNGKLPRGFLNSKPGAGHLNETGHRLVAEALADFLRAAGILEPALITDTH